MKNLQIYLIKYPILQSLLLILSIIIMKIILISTVSTCQPYPFDLWSSQYEIDNGILYNETAGVSVKEIIVESTESSFACDMETIQLSIFDRHQYSERLTSLLTAIETLPKTYVNETNKDIKELRIAQVIYTFIVHMPLDYFNPKYDYSNELRSLYMEYPSESIIQHIITSHCLIRVLLNETPEIYQDALNIVLDESCLIKMGKIYDEGYNDVYNHIQR